MLQIESFLIVYFFITGSTFNKGEFSVINFQYW